MSAEAEAVTPESHKARVFISYSRKDMAFADRLEAALKARGFEPLVDRAEIYAFEDWWKRIEGLIGKCDSVVFVLSPDSVASPVCGKEVAYADSLNKRFAPIVCRRTDDSLTPEPLRRLNFIFFDDPASFEASADRLSEALTTDIDWIRRHTEYGEAERRWSAAGRPSGLLLRSPVLEEAEAWIASRPSGAPEPTAQTQAFITESRRGTTRRRNILTASLSAGLIVALALAGLAYWQRGIALDERQHAIASLTAATRTANSLIYDLAGRFKNQTGIPASVVKDIISRAQQLQEELIASGQTSPDLQYSQASALSEVSLTLMTVGDRPGALQAADHARKILEGLLATSPGNTAWQLDLGVTYQRIGNVLDAEGKRADALAAFEKARDIHRALVDADNANDKAQSNLAVDHFKIGHLLQDDGQLDAALSEFEQDVKIMSMLVERNKRNADWWRDLGIAFESAGDVLIRQNKLDRALAYLRSRLEIAEALVKDAPTNTEYQLNLSVANNKMGDVLMRQGKADEALVQYRKSLDIRQALSDSDPANVTWLRLVAISHNMIGTAQGALNRLDDALDAFGRGLKIEEQLASRDRNIVLWQQDLFLSYTAMGNLLARKASLDASLSRFRDALAISAKQTSDHPDNTYWQKAHRYCVQQIGAVAFDLLLAGDFNSALQATEQAIAAAPDMIGVEAVHAHALMLLGRTDEARALYLRYRGQKNVKGDKGWDAVVREQFSQLRQGGLERPLMGEVETALATADQ